MWYSQACWPWCPRWPGRTRAPRADFVVCVMSNARYIASIGELTFARSRFLPILISLIGRTRMRLGTCGPGWPRCVVATLKWLFRIVRDSAAELTHVTVVECSCQLLALCIVGRTDQKVVIRVTWSTMSFRAWLRHIDISYILILKRACRRRRQDDFIWVCRWRRWLAQHEGAVFELVGEETDANGVITFDQVVVALTR